MTNSQPEPLLLLVTGSRGAGKTTFCSLIAEAARTAGWQVAGIISRPLFEENLRAAIDAEDLRTGELRRLAVRSDHPSPGSHHWKFDETVLDWGDQVLANSTPCDLLVVDELGPLELERGEGWQNGLAAVETQKYAIAIVVVRAEMLGELMVRWQNANLVEIDTPEDSLYKARVIADQLF